MLCKVAETIIQAESVAVFKLIMVKAVGNGAIEDLCKENVDCKSEVSNMDNTTFVQEVCNHDHANSTQIKFLGAHNDGIEVQMESINLY